nr:hypothetical protein L203_04787 [Cryptococcus depauperatus CBS 7841]
MSDKTASVNEKPAKEVLSLTTTDGKTATAAGAVSGNLATVLPKGSFLGVMNVEDGLRSFVGNQLGPNEVFTKYVLHDQNTARLLFRPRSVRPNLEFFHPEEKSLEVNLSVKDWTITAAYPTTSLLPDVVDDKRKRLRWFLRVHPSGTVEDLLTGTRSNGIFYEMLPSPKPRPGVSPDPQAPLVPAWPDIRPSNAWCLPQSIFIPHIDRVLETLGVPVESRTSMITGWLPGITRHKNIVRDLSYFYSLICILHKNQLEPSTSLRFIPPPQVFLRIFILFKGVPDSELKDWQNAGILHAEMGLDWRGSVGWTPDLANEELFRVIEYGAMEAFNL